MSDSENSVDVRLSRIEGTVDQMDKRLSRVEAQVDRTSDELDWLKDRMDRRFAEMNKRIDAHHDSLERSMRRWTVITLIIFTMVVTISSGVIHHFQ